MGEVLESLSISRDSSMARLKSPRASDHVALEPE